MLDLDSTFTTSWQFVILSFLGLELIALQSKPQDTSCLPALKVSDIEPKIPFTLVETTLTGWCYLCLVSQRAALLGYFLAAGPAVAPCPAHGLALWPIVVLFPPLQPSTVGRHGSGSTEPSPLRDSIEQPPRAPDGSSLLQACSHLALQSEESLAGTFSALEQSPHFPKAYPSCRTLGS